MKIDTDKEIFYQGDINKQIKMKIHIDELIRRQRSTVRHNKTEMICICSYTDKYVIRGWYT